ncbi:hypothetical protein ACFYWP_34650 [Actinacidiphila glaucinigra]|uniref:hypothetical protein n=1 Tax=Actinacidiphila glaucinigra TaxID=235986 RepID=UPI0036D101B5
MSSDLDTSPADDLLLLLRRAADITTPEAITTTDPEFDRRGGLAMQSCPRVNLRWLS